MTCPAVTVQGVCPKPPPDPPPRPFLQGSRKLLLIVVGALLLSNGCMSKEQGDALQRDVDRLKQEMRAEQERSDDSLTRLKTVMEQATALSTRNSADASVQVERLQLEVSRLAGMLEQNSRAIEELRNQLNEQQRQAQDKDAGGQPQLPDDPDQLFSQGTSLLAADKHEQGRQVLRHFINRFPQDARAPKAQLALGDSYYRQQRFAPAIQEYRKILDAYKTSREVPDALYQIGMSFYQLKYCSDAENFFKELLKKSPTHPKATQAKKVLQLIRRFRRNRRVCTS